MANMKLIDFIEELQEYNPWAEVTFYPLTDEDHGVGLQKGKNVNIPTLNYVNIGNAIDAPKGEETEVVVFLKKENNGRHNEEPHSHSTS